MTNHKTVRATALTAFIVILVAALWQWSGKLISYAIAQHVEESQKKMKEEINKSIKVLEDEGKEKANEVKELSEKVSELSGEVKLLSQRVETLSDDVDSLTDNIKELTKQLHDLLLVLARQNE